MDVETRDRSVRIRALNDAFRQTFQGGRVMMTSGVADLPDEVKAAVLQLVASFNQFTEDNDPHGEHDFGSFVLADQKLFWKIDYYDERCEFGSEDPSDPKCTTRVLTVMSADEY
ncbi:DUF3768 domain-containing protein [Bradyrhizobium sp. CCGUVB1N3]|uniref:DUF3768 domain-containing protein n=1 Tax=Bradyrhizobium sp. CCGUVB1N3 TaxID=2949629 RepID=UPI0020B26790|nr:DUF3768 domain-containing protein [Bradyrhizobium sp. CCGUVB1N3]MCP3475053.1 DUF3768 domain-containing protein [Bradyrhizobium sp. CCGUVB1N3]